MKNSREKRKKAIEEKLNNAAIAANIYIAESVTNTSIKRITSAEARRNRNRKVTMKIIAIARNSVIYAFSILVICAACLIPFKNTIVTFVQNNYLTEEQEFKADVKLIKDFTGSEKASGKIYKHEIKEPALNTAFAKIYSEELGINSYIYYGESYEALKEGVIMIENGRFPGYRTSTELYGYNTTHFDGLKNIKKGDIITITTNYGVFKYEVTSTLVSSKAHSDNLDQKDEDILIIKTDYPLKTLNGVSDKTFIVNANRISGPTVIY